MKVLETRYQKKTLEALKAFIEKNGYLPTIRELTENVGCSVEWTHQVLNQLLELGFVEKTEMRKYKPKE